LRCGKVHRPVFPSFGLAYLLHDSKNAMNTRKQSGIKIFRSKNAYFYLTNTALQKRFLYYKYAIKPFFYDIIGKRKRADRLCIIF
jgi:hypothetical protein